MIRSSVIGGISASALLFFVLSAAQAKDQRILLKQADFDPKSLGQAHFSNEDRAVLGLYLLQFNETRGPAVRADIQASGGEIVAYIPNSTFLVRIKGEKALQLGSQDSVRAVLPYKPEYKMQRPVQDFLRNLGTQKTGEFVIMATSLADKAAVVELTVNSGATIVNPQRGFQSFIATLRADQILKIAYNRNTLWMQESTATGLDMENARKVGGTEAVSARLPAFTGQGIIGHVMEGVYDEHPDFAATEFRKAPIAIGDDTPDWHGSATYGIVFGSGAGLAKAKGMLPDAQGYFTNREAVMSGGVSRYELVKNMIKDFKVMFQTASWGHTQTYEYTAESAEMDKIIFDLDIPITQSQSNMGSVQSRPQAWAKNIISVGALYHFNNDDMTDDSWNYGGSIGPSKDGRIKPDLSAFYDEIDTTDSASGYMTDFGGTSGATPIVAGHVGLTIQMWTDGLFGNVLVPEGDRFANRPHASTVKALLINTARQHQFEGLAHDRTRSHQGWGFPNLDRMNSQKDRLLVVNEEHILKQGETRVYKVTVEAGESELKATFVSMEPEAAVPSSVQKLNNMDLKVTSPTGEVFWGNNGLLESMYSKAGGVANTIDPVENVFVKDPAAGEWTVEVIASELNVDTHVETPEIDADYALVVSGLALRSTPVTKLRQ